MHRYLPHYSLTDSKGKVRFDGGRSSGTYEGMPIVVETRDDPMFSSDGGGSRT